jgi:hypothetical protein
VVTVQIINLDSFDFVIGLDMIKAESHTRWNCDNPHFVSRQFLIVTFGTLLMLLGLRDV